MDAFLSNIIIYHLRNNYKNLQIPPEYVAPFILNGAGNLLYEIVYRYNNNINAPTQIIKIVEYKIESEILRQVRKATIRKLKFIKGRRSSWKIITFLKRKSHLFYYSDFYKYYLNIEGEYREILDRVNK